MTPSQRVGLNIKVLSERAGMSFDDLKDETEGRVSVALLKDWEVGLSVPTLLQAHELACCFGVPMERFFEGVEWDG